MNTSLTNRSFFIHTRLPQVLLTIAVILLALALYLTTLNPSSPSPIPPTPPTPLTNAITMQTAWGANLNIPEIPTAIDDNHIFIFETATPDGKYLLGTLYPKALTTEPGKLVLLDVQTQQITEIHELSYPTTQVRKADADSDWITWMEAPYEDPQTYAWDIYAYNRKTHESKKLAGEPMPQVCSGCGTDTTFLTITHGTLLWYQVSYSSRPPSSSTLFNNTDLTTGETTQISGVDNPSFLSWPNLAWVNTTQPSSSAGTQKDQTTTFKARNLQTGETTSIPMSENDSLLAMYDGTLAWTNESGEIYTTDYDRLHLQSLIKPDLMAPTQMNSRLIILSDRYTRTTELYAWDLQQKRLVQLAGASEKPITSQLKNNILVWTTGIAANKDDPNSPITGFPQTPDQIIHILDISSLPATNP